VQDALEPGGPCLDPGSVIAQQPALEGRVVRAQQLPDRVERHLQIAEPDDGPRRLELSVLVQPVATRRVDPGRPEQVQLVVVAERPDGQSGQPGEPTDAQQLVHQGILNPPVAGESRP
jgi:hypothetical protein